MPHKSFLVRSFQLVLVLNILQFCRYRFPQSLIQKTHFEHEFELIHIKRNDKWLNNVNPWIMNVCCCNHDLKFIAIFGKDGKTLIYYITNYIMKTTNYTSHMYSLVKIGVQKIQETYSKTNSNDHLEKIHCLIIRSFNTIGFQQEISSTRIISYLMKLPNHITNVYFSTIPWYSLSTWILEHEKTIR
jgi:hypothetical protein